MSYGRSLNRATGSQNRRVPNATYDVSAACPVAYEEEEERGTVVRADGAVEPRAGVRITQRNRLKRGGNRMLDTTVKETKKRNLHPKKKLN